MNLLNYVISMLYNLVDVCWWRSNEVMELLMGLEKLKCWKTSLSSTAVSFSICCPLCFDKAVKNNLIVLLEALLLVKPLTTVNDKQNLYVDLQIKITHLTTQTNCLNMFGHDVWSCLYNET